jgi:hypothetical protein
LMVVMGCVCVWGGVFLCDEVTSHVVIDGVRFHHCITTATKPPRRLWATTTLQARGQHTIRTLCVVASLLPP